MTVPSDFSFNTIERDAPCYGCGYNLRSLAYDASCPECGKVIADWVRADRIAEIDPVWLGRLRRGALFLQVGVIAALPLIYPGLVIATIGLWMITARQAGQSETPADRAARLGARWCLGLGLLTSTIGFVGIFWNFGGQYQRLFGNWFAYDAAMIAAAALGVLGLASAWLYLSQFARRLPDGFLSRRCATLRRDWFIAAGIFIAISMVTNLVNALGLNHSLYPFGLVAPAALALVPLTLTLVWLWWRTLGMTVTLRRTLHAL